jgi:hypothetical protein
VEAARRLAVDLGVDRVHVAARARPAAVVVPDGVAWVTGPAAAPVRIRLS